MAKKKATRRARRKQQLYEYPEKVPQLAEEQVVLAALKKHPRNYKRHTDEQLEHIAHNIRREGIWKNVVVSKDGYTLAGHGVVEAAIRAGVEVGPARRVPVTHEHPRAIAIVVADNETSRLAENDDAALAGLLSSIRDWDGLLGTGFNDSSLVQFVADATGAGGRDDDAYTKKIQAPIYEPRGERPAVGELVDQTRSRQLLAAIEKAKAPEEVKTFLRLAAQRHTVFNYERIAEFYAHAPRAVKDLFEESALVIIDFKKAIERGFVVMTEEIARGYPNAAE